MAWEKRQGKGRYYTRSQRINGRVVRRYVGTGPAAELAATEDALSCVERKVETETEKAKQRRHEELTAPLDELCSLTDLLLKAALLSAGYHQHDRGAWRRRKHVPEQNDRPEDVSGRATGTTGESQPG
jgi:hypothetical protein